MLLYLQQLFLIMTNEEIKKKRDEIYKILLSKCACITLNDEVNTKNFTSMEATKIVNFLESSKREEIIIFYVGLNLNETSYQRLTQECGVDNRFQAIETKHHVLTFRIFKEGCRVIFANCNDNDNDKEPCGIAKLDDLPLLFEVSEI